MNSLLKFKSGQVWKQEVLIYSPIRQQWGVAFDSDGTVEGLLGPEWCETKRDALLKLKRRLDFRLGITSDCTILYKRLDAIEKEINK